MTTLKIDQLNLNGGTHIDKRIVAEYTRAYTSVKQYGGVLFDYLTPYAIFADFTFLYENLDLAKQIKSVCQRHNYEAMMDTYEDKGGLCFHALKGDGVLYKKNLDTLSISKTVESKAHGLQKGDVYFIQGIGGGPIKIGYSNNKNDRLSALQSCSPVELRIIAVIHSAGMKKEKELHARFSRHRMHGEWFRPNHELEALIQYLNKENS